MLRGVVSNRALVVVPGRTRFGWRLGRLSPRLMERMLAKFVAQQREQMKTAGQKGG
jgi:hypothetical protein